LSSAEARAADASSQVAGAIKEAASLRVDLTHAKEAIRASRKELAHATRPSSRSLGASASAAALDRSSSRARPSRGEATAAAALDAELERARRQVDEQLRAGIAAK